MQVIRGDVVEHQEITPFYEVKNYQVQCNYRFVVNVPMNCSHIHLFFISEDIHPVSEKPKLIARASDLIEAFLEDVICCIQGCPLKMCADLYRLRNILLYTEEIALPRIAFRVVMFECAFSGKEFVSMTFRLENKDLLAVRVFALL